VDVPAEGWKMANFGVFGDAPAEFGRACHMVFSFSLICHYRSSSCITMVDVYLSMFVVLPLGFMNLDHIWSLETVCSTNSFN
jgi:hypothetical protein